MIKSAFLFLPLLCVTASPGFAEPLPKPVYDMIENAADTGNKAVLKAVVDMAKKSNPKSIAEIDAQVADLNGKAEQARIKRLKEQSFFKGWSGEGQAGMSSTTGNSSNVSVALGLNMNHEGLFWRHKFAFAADYQKADGIKTANKYLASYEADYKVSKRFFMSGILEWEKDRFAGYNNRYTVAPGFGYDLIKSPKFSWQVTGGPAYRQTRLITGMTENTISARASTDITWNILDNVALTENAAAFLNDGNKTYLSTTAATAKIYGSLSARISYEVKYESEPPLGLGTTDTTSRLTLVYGF